MTSKLIRDGIIYSDYPQMKRRKGGSMCASLPGTREFILDDCMAIGADAACGRAWEGWKRAL